MTPKRATQRVLPTAEARRATQSVRPAADAREELNVVRHIGRPVAIPEPWTCVTVVMTHRHVAYLDLVAVAIRLRHSQAITRAEIIRALVEFMEKSGIDFSQFATVEAMVEYLTAYFGALPRRGRHPLLDSGAFNLFETKQDEAVGGEALRDPRGVPREADVLLIR
jgi:hypothetical protein